MLHKFFDKGVWFAPKRYGYGAGLPIAWQGWFLYLAYILLMIGLVAMVRQLPRAELGRPVVGIVILTILFLVIVARRTRGGWRWRWGEKE